MKVLALAVLLRSVSLAGSPGSAGADFLQLGAGPRAVAMGEGHVAVADDAYAAYWNPAGLAQLRYTEAALTHMTVGQGITHQFLSLAHPFGPGQAVAASVTRLDSGEIESYDATGARRGSVDAADMAAQLSYGRLVAGGTGKAPELRAGVGGKYIHERLANVSASTFAGDLGLLVSRLDNALGEKARGFRAGFAVRNMGPGLKFHTERTKLPRSYAGGLAWEGQPWGDPMTASAEMKTAVDDGLSGSFGVEYWVRRVLAVRAGYVTGQDEGLGLRFGIGIRLKRVLVEYAMAGYGDLGDRHRFGLSYRFGGAPDVAERGPQDFISRGRAYLEQKRYYEAVTEFNRALELDPGNKAALEDMRRALKAMEDEKR